MRFNVFELRHSSILYLYSQRMQIQINPDYQRMGEVWNFDKRQLLIDSIINDFDIPKLYFHDLRDFGGPPEYDFAIIDGRQRLEAIWSFIDRKFALSESFEYLKDKKVKAGGLTYKELARYHPNLKQVFDASSLSVFVVQTDEIDLIEEMFSRLNEAVPLNAAEKRNAFGGPLPRIVREIAGEGFFKENLKVSNKRYQHRDLAAKFIYLAYSEDIVDTKKVYLDTFFKENKDNSISNFSKSIKTVKFVLNEMSREFTKSDSLLKSSGMSVLYFIVFMNSIMKENRGNLSRVKFLNFEGLRNENREIAEISIADANYDLLEFDRLTQTPNDAYALKFRASLLEAYVHRGRTKL